MIQREEGMSRQEEDTHRSNGLWETLILKFFIGKTQMRTEHVHVEPKSYSQS